MVKRVRQAMLTVLFVAVGVRAAWALLTPAVPVLVSIAVVVTVLWIAVFGRRSL